MPVLLTIYLLVWLTSFLDSGYFKTEAECKLVQSNITLFSILLALPIFPLIGCIADKVSP